MRFTNTCFISFCGLLCLCLSASGQSGAADPVPVSEDEKALIAVARSAVIREVTGVSPPSSSAIVQRLPAQGVFVTIERDNTVIGCRGTLTPQTRSLAEEITAAARSAAGHDPRYRPLTPSDIRGFKVTVTLVDRLEPLSAGQIDTLLPAEGLVLSAGTHTGIVLPWEGKDPKVRLRWAYTKANVIQNSPCLLKRLIARRFRG